ncbi:MAG TPA: hypothetical protein VF411_11520, partial [Bacteroidia bacterium]
AKLGRENTVIILEGGCEWPSNIQGIDILIYENSIKEIFGDLISAIEKRMYRLFLENEKYSA